MLRNWSLVNMVCYSTTVGKVKEERTERNRMKKNHKTDFVCSCWMAVFYSLELSDFRRQLRILN